MKAWRSRSNKCDCLQHHACVIWSELCSITWWLVWFPDALWHTHAILGFIEMIKRSLNLIRTRDVAKITRATPSHSETSCARRSRLVYPGNPSLVLLLLLSFAEQMGPITERTVRGWIPIARLEKNSLTMKKVRIIIT